MSQEKADAEQKQLQRELANQTASLDAARAEWEGTLKMMTTKHTAVLEKYAQVRMGIKDSRGIPQRWHSTAAASAPCSLAVSVHGWQILLGAHAQKKAETKVLEAKTQNAEALQRQIAVFEGRAAEDAEKYAMVVSDPPHVAPTGDSGQNTTEYNRWHHLRAS